MEAANLVLVSTVLIWKTVQKIFLVPLRFREAKWVYTLASNGIIVYCFAKIEFREEANLIFRALVITLLILKRHYGLAKDIIDFRD